MRRKLILTYWVLAVSLFIPSLSYAYIDPATTTYIIQIVTALVITLGVTMSIALYKMKMFLMNIRIMYYEVKRRLFSKKQREDAKSLKEARRIGADAKGDGLQYGIPRPRQDYDGVVELPPEESKPEDEKAPKKKGIKGVLYFLFHDDRKLVKRVIMAALVAGILPMTILIFGILDLVISNSDVVIFSYKEILSIVLGSAFYYWIIFFIVMAVSRGKVFDFFISLMLGVGVMAYLQGTFLNVDIGQLTGDAIPWEDYKIHGIINLAIWIIVILGFYALRYFSKKIWTKAAIFLPSIIIVVQLVALISIMPSGTELIEHPKAPPHIIDRIAADVGIPYEMPEEKGKKGKEEKKGKKAHKKEELTPPHEIIEAKYGKLNPGEEYSLSTDGIYELSSTNNVIFFILDRLDERYINEVMEEKPLFFNRLDGFTSFTDNISEYSRTFPSVASTLTEKLYMFDVPATQYLTEAYRDSRFLPDIQDQDFTTKLYMERPYTYSDIEQLYGIADNINGIKFEVKIERTKKKLSQLSLFRYLPHVFKKPFVLSPHEFGKMRKATSSSGAKPYLTNDVLFYENLVNERLHVTTDRGNFIYYHMQGPHTPFTMTENIERVNRDESDSLRQTMGSFNILYEYMDQLKELGLYEDATIIITGDHGLSINNSEMPRMNRPIRTALFVKPSGSAGKPLAYSNASVNPINLRATVMQAVGGDYKSYGRTYFEVPEDENVNRKFLFRVNETVDHGPLLEEYIVNKNSVLWLNWHKVKEIAIEYWYG